MSDNGFVKIDDTLVCERCGRATRHFQMLDAEHNPKGPMACLVCLRDVIDGKVSLPRVELSDDASALLRAVAKHPESMLVAMAAAGLDVARARVALRELFAKDMIVKPSPFQEQIMVLVELGLAEVRGDGTLGATEMCRGLSDEQRDALIDQHPLVEPET